MGSELLCGAVAGDQRSQKIAAIWAAWTGEIYKIPTMLAITLHTLGVQVC